MTSLRLSETTLNGSWLTSDLPKLSGGNKTKAIDYSIKFTSTEEASKTYFLTKVRLSYRKFPLLNLFFNTTFLVAILGLLNFVITGNKMGNLYFLFLVSMGSLAMSLVIFIAVGEFESEKE